MNKKFNKLAKCFVLSTMVTNSIFMTSCTIKTTENNKKTVSVSGSGTVEVAADTATITLAVITRGKDVADAASLNASKMTKVQDAILALGIAQSDITTDGYTVFQESHYSSGKQILGDYNVTNCVKILIKDLNLVSDVIDSSLKAGANELRSCQYGLSNKDEFVKQARILAVQNAKEAANLIAGTCGATLGKVLTIQEHANSIAGKMYSVRSASMANDAILESSAVSTPINAGKSSITINVNATFELK